MDANGKPDVFLLRYRDTEPILEVALKNPDGSPRDLTGNTALRLHIWLSDLSKLIRTMTAFGALINGVVRYQWIATDWDVASGGNPAPVGGLILSPTIPLAIGAVEHRMLYEVIGPSPKRQTFPNFGNSTAQAYDILRIYDDIGQG